MKRTPTMISFHEAELLRYVHRQKGKASEARIRDKIMDGDLILARMTEIGTVAVDAEGRVQLTDLGRREIQV